MGRPAPNFKTDAGTSFGMKRSRKAGLLDAVRAFSVMSGGPALLAIYSALSLVMVGRRLAGPSPRNRSIPGLRLLQTFGALLPFVYALAVRPWHLRWGAPAEETVKRLPGDELVPNPGFECTRAVTVEAPVAAVWPWLAQIGQDGGGFYSYEWLENLAGCNMRNADRIHPEWQERNIGDTVLLHPANGLKLAVFEPPRAFVMEGSSGFVLEPIDERRTRLIARSRTPRGLPALAYAVFVEIPHFIMERKMLLGIKQRAEALAGGRGEH